MPRLINADTVVTIQVYDDMTEEYDTKKMTIAEAIDEWSDEGCPPTVDAEPVIHAHWEYVDYGGCGNYHCSNCRAISGTQYNGLEPILRLTKYCPNCGAKMDEEEENEAVS